MADGKTTEAPPPLHVMECFYVGNRNNFITFRRMHLPDGRVVVHSELHDASGPVEDFLYEVAERNEAFRCASTMVDDAEEYLQTAGVELDRQGSAYEFLQLLHEELYNRLH